MKKIKYDLTLIIKGDKSLEEAQKIFDDVKMKLEKLDFEIEKDINPVLKELAFEIKKYKQGYFGSFIFTADKCENKQMEELFKFNENILRFLTVIYDDVLAKPKMRISHRRQNISENKADVSEETKSEEAATENVPEKILSVEEKQEIEEQKSIDLENLDEKLDELLK